VLKTLAAALPGVVNGSMEFDAATLSPTYRFQKGIPGRSYGLAIARRLGVDSAVLARAEAQVPERERALDALLHEVERRDQAVRAREVEVTARAEEASERIANLDAREELAEEREKELRRNEKDADQRARRQARDYMLDARNRVEAALAAAGSAKSGLEAREARKLVEDAIAELKTTDGQAETGRRADGLTGGQHVRLNSGTKARIAEVRPDGKLVLIAGNVRMTVPPDEIAEVLPVSPSARPPVPSPSVSEDAEFEIDLRGLRVDEAEAAIISALDAAVIADNPFLRIIHGKGTGAVRERVHAVLKGDRRVTRYGLAPANQGGSGATIVEFRS